MRKPIDKGNCVEIGFIKKTHGVAGEVLVVFPEGLDPVFEKLDYLFFEVDGLLVPFFIESLHFRSDTTVNIQLGLIGSQEKAKQFVGCRLFTEKENIEISEEGFHLEMLKGFTLLDKTIGQIGPVLFTENFGGNMVLTVKYLNREVMVPINEDLIVRIDREQLILVMDLPVGLLDED